MDGYAVASHLRATGAGGARLVALSGYAQPEDVARALESGFDAHVAKPPDPERLASILELPAGRRAADPPAATAP
jgi:CheY-like chemotaxis protein